MQFPSPEDNRKLRSKVQLPGKNAPTESDSVLQLWHDLEALSSIGAA